MNNQAKFKDFLKIFIFFFIFLIFNSLNLSVAHSFSLISISEKDEIELGKVYANVAIDEYGGRFPEPEVQAYLQRLGKKIAEQSPRKVAYTFSLVNSGIENAFALPGGPVFVTRGLFLMVDTESELACVLGHEIGHITARHHIKFVEKNMTLSLLLQIGSLFLPQNLAGEALYQLAQISAGLLSLKFSRDQEREADAYGFEFSIKAGYSPEGMYELFKKFKEREKKRPPEWLSTHPLPESRIKEWQEKMQTYKPTGALIKDREEFQRIKAIILATTESFRLSDEAEKLFKDKKIDLAKEKFMKALELYPKNIPALLGLSKILLNQKRFDEAKEYAKRAKVLDENLSSAYILEGIAELNLKNYQQALIDFEKAKELIPFNGYAYYLAGRANEELGKRKEALNNYKKALDLGPSNAQWYPDCKRRYQMLRGIPLPF
jgi:predicted Zn-dependent protease